MGSCETVLELYLERFYSFSLQEDDEKSSQEKGHREKHQGMTTKSKNHIDRDDFHISPQDNCSLVSSLMTFTAVKTSRKSVH